MTLMKNDKILAFLVGFKLPEIGVQGQTPFPQFYIHIRVELERCDSRDSLLDELERAELVLFDS